MPKQKHIVVTCDECGKSHTIAASKVPQGKALTGKCTCGHKILINNPEAPSIAKANNPEKKCPKCGIKTQTDAESCMKCGVIFARYEEIQRKNNEKDVEVQEPHLSKEKPKLSFAEKFKIAIRGILPWFKNLPVWKKVFIVALVSYCLFNLIFKIIPNIGILKTLAVSPIYFVIFAGVPYLIVTSITEYLIYVTEYFSYAKKKSRLQAVGPAQVKKKSSFKPLGVIVTVIGTVALLFSMGMDTSVYTGYGGGRVNNIGLMNDKQNYIILSCFGILIGILITSFSAIKTQLSKKNAKPLPPPQRDEKECPECAENVLAKAKKCRFCGYIF